MAYSDDASITYSVIATPIEYQALQDTDKRVSVLHSSVNKSVGGSATVDLGAIDDIAYDVDFTCATITGTDLNDFALDGWGGDGLVEFLFVRNTDTANFVTISLDGANHWDIRLNAGEAVAMRLNSTPCNTIFIKADTASVDCEVLIGK